MGADADQPRGPLSGRETPSGVSGFAGSPGERFVAGDPLRGVGTLAVMLAHVLIVIAVFVDVERAFGAAGTLIPSACSFAVYWFFVLSAYLISAPFVRWACGGKRPHIRRYLRNRVLRIVPAFWVISTVLLVLEGAGRFSTAEVLSMYAFLQSHLAGNDGLIPQAWSLAVEWQFYLVIPVVMAAGVWALRRVGSPRSRALALGGALLGLGAASLVARALIPEQVGPVDATYFLIVGTFWTFAPGVGLALLEVSGAREWARRRHARHLPSLLLLIAAAAVAVYTATQDGQIASVDRGPGGMLLIAVATGGFVAAPLVLQWSGRPCWRALDNRVLNWVGVRSYSIYLIHWAMLWEVVRWTIGLRDAPGLFLAAVVVLGVPLSLILGHLSYELVERPCFQLGRRRRPAEQPAPVPQPAHALSRRRA